jgi:hypothetical protein
MQLDSAGASAAPKIALALGVFNQLLPVGVVAPLVRSLFLVSDEKGRPITV